MQGYYPQLTQKAGYKPTGRPIDITHLLKLDLCVNTHYHYYHCCIGYQLQKSINFVFYGSMTYLFHRSGDHGMPTHVSCAICRVM